MKYTKYQYSRNLAWEILLRERVRQLPVEIIPICKHMGIRVLRYSDMPSLQFNAGGSSAEIGGKMYIFYDDTAPEERQRFTVAHELGHIIMRHSGAEDNEAEANVFASRLLMPACVLYACEVKTVDEIMSLCAVSRQAAEIRLTRLEELRRRDKFYTHPLERKVARRFRGFVRAYHRFQSTHPRVGCD